MSDSTTELQADTHKTEPETESGKMSFLEHLDELRKRLVHIAVYMAIGFGASWSFHKQIYNFIAVPVLKALPPGTKLTYLKLTEPFLMYMKVAFIAGIFLTIPFTLYEVWKFIAPGLYRKEKRYVVPFLVISMFLFLLGGAFCYYIVLPPACKWLINFGDAFTPNITINEYFDMANMMLLGFGLVFEMPVVAGFLAIFGLVSASFLWKKFKYAFLLIVILAAVLSPTGDPFNLMLWSAPMVVLYIVSIGVAALFGWNRKKKGLV
jgi:sec-independent protein translocase protein TatC